MPTPNRPYAGFPPVVTTMPIICVAYDAGLDPDGDPSCWVKAYYQGTKHLFSFDNYGRLISFDGRPHTMLAVPALKKLAWRIRDLRATPCGLVENFNKKLDAFADDIDTICANLEIPPR